MTADRRRAIPWDGGGLAERTPVTTARGPMPVEALRPGDELHAPHGTWRAARIERHVFHAGSMRWSGHAPPVRIEAGALGRGLPQSDLILGAAQDILLDGASWPAAALVTGTTIRIQPSGAPVVLFRIWPERDVHGSTLAVAGVACAAAPAPVRFHDADMDGLSQLRLRLQRQAGQVPGALQGNLDQVAHGGLIGWAFDASNPQSPVCLDVRVGGVRAGTVIANRFRPDLAGIAGAPTHCGFSWRPQPALALSASLLLALHRTGDGEMLPGCPVLLPALSASPLMLERAIAAIAADGRPLADAISAGLATLASG